MTQEIIRMAREVESEVGFQWCVNFIELARFASLVRADEREACALVCDELHPGLATKRAAEIIRARSQA
jgi:hypothetical protein